MALQSLSVKGYRSIRELEMRLDGVNVLVGPNGCGKSNLYRALVLLAAAAEGRLARSLAQEGGMPSALWAGKRMRDEPVRMTVAVEVEEVRYSLSLGLPVPDDTIFKLDPLVKRERLTALTGGRGLVLMERGPGNCWLRDAEGRRVDFPLSLTESESVLSQISAPDRFPQLAVVARELRSWRFYHQFRTDWDSPARLPQLGTRSPVLDADGGNLAAVIQTIREIGDSLELEQTVQRGFPGAKLGISMSEDGMLSLRLHLPGFHRGFSGRELSDGTLRYLCLAAALLSPRHPRLIALNEPETSLHPALLEPLARLVSSASAHSQIWVTTHSNSLAASIGEQTGAEPARLQMVAGETRIPGQSIVGFADDD